MMSPNIKAYIGFNFNKLFRGLKKGSITMYEAKVTM